MPGFRSWTTLRHLLRVFTLAVMAVASLGIVLLSEARAETVRLLLDRPIDGTAAPLAQAIDSGLFRAENLAVNLETPNGAADVLARLANGDGEFALVDINALMRYRDQQSAAEIKAIYILMNDSGYAIIARRNRGIQHLADLAGKTLGFAETDMSIKFWPALTRIKKIAPETVKLEAIGAAVREPMLSAGQVDAVTGLAYLSPINLRDRGIPADDLALFPFSNYGIRAYGHAFVVNPKYAAEHPDSVRGFLRAINAALRATIRSPDKAIDDVMQRITTSRRDIELQRLHSVLRHNIVTDEVKAHGLGGIDIARFSVAIDQMAEGFKFRKKPTPEMIFDGTFLPPAASRHLH
ncbi:MAG TPA: ABC transporter substrate-binding protein [Xanthobacteraceae bacterium]|nr:ABC transporter substrate-binding protein [Xanthobacteraceae bacterium]